MGAGERRMQMIATSSLLAMWHQRVHGRWLVCGLASSALAVSNRVVQPRRTGRKALETEAVFVSALLAAKWLHSHAVQAVLLLLLAVALDQLCDRLALLRLLERHDHRAVGADAQTGQSLSSSSSSSSSSSWAKRDLANQPVGDVRA